jgi:hypothetical protein
MNNYKPRLWAIALMFGFGLLLLAWLAGWVR